MHDPEWRKWSVRPDGTMTGIDDAFADYKAHQFRDYLDRGWCRLEMFFNAYMPFRTARAKLFGGRLEQIMREESRRPHLVFGTRELECGEMPVILRALREDEIDVYHPANGYLTSHKDVEVLKEHMKQLSKISISLKVWPWLACKWIEYRAKCSISTHILVYFEALFSAAHAQ